MITLSNGARRPRAPVSLGPAGRAFWRSVLADYELSPAEAELLRQACRVVDVLARLDAAIADADDLMVEGSAGQMKTHPALAAAADQRRVLDVLLRSVALPMPEEAEGRRRSPAAQAAAQARWRAQRG